MTARLAGRRSDPNTGNEMNMGSPASRLPTKLWLRGLSATNPIGVIAPSFVACLSGDLLGDRAWVIHETHDATGGFAGPGHAEELERPRVVLEQEPGEVVDP